MCNYCQMGSVFSNGCGYTPRWRVQRICYDSSGNIHVIVTNGCVCRRLTCGEWQEYPYAVEENTPETNGNGCFGGCRNQTNHGCFGGCAGAATRCGTATQDSEQYYARLYGLNTNASGRGCGCTPF